MSARRLSAAASARPRARDRRRRHQVGLRGGRRRHRVGGFRNALRDPGAGCRPARARHRSELRRRRQDAAQRRPDLARRRRPVPAAGHRRRGRQGGVHQGRPAAQAAGHDRGHRFPVQGHHRLVRARRRRARPLPLQRPGACIAPGPTTAPAPGNSSWTTTCASRASRARTRRAASRAPGARSPSSCSATRRTSRREPSRGRTRESRARARATSRRAIMASASQVGRARARSGTAPLSRAAWSSARGRKASSSCSTGSMTEIIREQPFSGRVLGIKASYTPRFNPDTRRALESLWQNGNVDERRATINIRAKRARHRRQRRSRRQSAVPQHVLSRVQRARVRVERLGAARAPRRRMPAASSPACGSAPILRACSRTSGSPRASTSRRGWRRATPTPTCCPATRPSRSADPPASRSGTSSYEHLIAVNQVGKRFFNEMDVAKRYGSPVWPGGPRIGVPKPFAPARPVRLAQLQPRAGSSRCTTAIPRSTPPWR